MGWGQWKWLPCPPVLAPPRRAATAPTLALAVDPTLARMLEREARAVASCAVNSATLAEDDDDSSLCALMEELSSLSSSRVLAVEACTVGMEQRVLEGRAMRLLLRFVLATNL